MKTNLKKIRNKQNLTQKQLAEKSGVSRPHIAGIEVGETMSIEVLQKLCTALKCSSVDMLEF